MNEPRPQWTTTPPVASMISVIPETDWQARLCGIVEALRDRGKGCIIWYDARLNLLRIVEYDSMRTVKLD